MSGPVISLHCLWVHGLKTKFGLDKNMLFMRDFLLNSANSAVESPFGVWTDLFSVRNIFRSESPIV